MKRLTLGLALTLVAATSSADDLKVGAASVAITPAAGTPMAGYYYERAADGVRDDLFAKAIVFEKDGKRVALVGLDLITTPRGIAEAARAAIEGATKVRGADVMISATHAHTGPVLGSRTPREESLGGKSDLTRAYTDALPAKIAEAVRLAEAKLAPATVSAGHGHEASIAFNRRFHMLDGSVGWNPGVLNPKILKAAGTIDPDVAVLHVEGKTNKVPVATYVNYAVHLDTIGGKMISADMPGTVSRLLGDVKGPGMVTLYTTGCCGDINHINVGWGGRQQGPEFSTRMGIILAAEVLKTWPTLKPVGDGPIRVLAETVKLPLPPIKAGAVEAAREVVGRHRDPKAKQPTFLEAVEAYKVLDVAAREGRPQEVEVQVIALGDDVAWVSLPGEIFVELGLAIKADSPFPHTVVAELANGAIGYIPSRRAYAQGNYEVVSARCAEGSGELLVDAAVRMLKALHAPSPTPAR